MSYNNIHETGILFTEVQLKNIFSDGKTFPDCVPKSDLNTIVEKYLNTKDSPNFNLKAFITEHFDEPQNTTKDFKTVENHAIEAHIHALWDVLTRQPDTKSSSLIPLPYPYIVPGGRFREIYYWDSYFTMLGLQQSKRWDLIESMIDNFAYLINKIGHIPNGNRTYYIGRSQPPFFSLMIKILAQHKKNVLEKYLPELEKEYAFWMANAEHLSPNNNAIDRVVLLPDGSILNRYWDENATPRPESYKEDVELAHQTANPLHTYRHIRAAAESGWDFSSRWFKDVNSFASIHTTDIIPVDLNCLLYHLEKTIADIYELNKNVEKAKEFNTLAEDRKQAINTYCWYKKGGFYFDYDYKTQQTTEHYTLAAAFPLFFNVANSNQATKVAKIIKIKFLQKGGLTTTLHVTGQQWDAPNGWAPLQWITYKGLMNYELTGLANKIKTNWLNTNRKVYENTGKMTEKYNVFTQDAAASGGEYPNQDGFGWTNGVFLAM